MRYFLLIFFLGVAAVVSVLGLRGSTSRKPPLEFFDDMDRQPKLRPQTTSKFAGFADGLSSRLPVGGTVARGSAWEDNEFNTGKKADGSFVEANPAKVTAEFLRRGQERFNIYCLPCHGALADGQGITKKFGMAVVANLQDQRILKMPDGEIFNTASVGKNLMNGYADKLDASDRWAVIAYIRALQLSRLGTTEDLPADVLAKLKK